jgi:hypothetical protein
MLFLLHGKIILKFNQDINFLKWVSACSRPESVVAVVFQSVFYLKMYQNNIFFIFKNLFLRSAHQHDLKTPKNINLK